MLPQISFLSRARRKTADFRCKPSAFHFPGISTAHLTSLSPPMKFTHIASIVFFVCTGLVHANFTMTLTGVHNCCGRCDKDIVKAIESVKGVKARTKKDQVIITAMDQLTAMQGVAALFSAGFYGEGAGTPPVVDAKVKIATVMQVHLCCGKCVNAVEKASKTVTGVTKLNPYAGATFFTVEGDFSTRELDTALNKVGLSASIIEGRLSIEQQRRFR
jgi:periplasmic mercuric ion binding protein